MKTTRQWLEQAKSEGYGWAEQALNNMVYNDLWDSLSEALFSFSWGDSPQGEAYWAGIYDDIHDRELNELRRGFNGNGYLPISDSRNNILSSMKPILAWLEEAKEQGYEWADAAIRNYDPNYAPVSETESLSEALKKAFPWGRSSEKRPYWDTVYNSLINVGGFCAAAQLSVGYDKKQELATFYDSYRSQCNDGGQKPLSKNNFSKCLKQLGYTVQKGTNNKTFVWYNLRTAEAGRKDHSTINAVSPTLLEDLTEALRKLNNAIEAYEEQLSEVKPTSLESLIEDLGKLNNALGNLAYNDTLKEPYRTQVYEATKASYEEQLAEVKAKIAGVLGIEPIKERKLIGWVVQNEDDTYSMWILPTFTKEDGGWSVVGTKNWVDITPEQAIALCGRVPKWSDDEPIPVYEK